MFTFDLRYKNRESAITALDKLGLITKDSHDNSIIPTSIDTDDGKVEITVASGGTGIIVEVSGEVAPGIILPNGMAGPAMPMWAPIPGYHLTIKWYGENPPKFGKADITKDKEDF